MSVEMAVTIRGLLSGLGEEFELNEKNTVTGTVSSYTSQYRTQAVADTEEALDLGGVSTVELIIIKAITNDMTIDADFDTAFDGDILVAEGEVSVFKPAGTVYITNTDAAEQVTYEYIVVGS
jgi:hypothetical protein